MSSNRKVLMLCSQVPPVYGGAGTQALLLAEELGRLGWRTRLISLDQNGVGSNVQSGVDIRRVCRGKQPDSTIRRLHTTFVLTIFAVWNIIAWRPAVVHIHGAYWWSVLPAVVGRMVGARVLVKLTRDGEDDALTVTRRRLGPIPVGKVYGLSLSASHHIITLNADSYKKARVAGLGHKAILATNGVDSSRMLRSADRRSQARDIVGIGEGESLYLFAGYLARHKGVFDLLDAWELGGDKDAHLWLAGPAQGFYRELGDDALARIDELRHSGFRVRHVGYVPSREMPSYYWAADVFVLPSYAEGMPNSLMEATVAGCQVIGTRIPGIKDILDEDEAWLVDPGSTRQLLEALRGARAAPRMASPDTVRHFGIEHLALRYSDLYKFGRLAGSPKL